MTFTHDAWQESVATIEKLATELTHQLLEMPDLDDREKQSLWALRREIFQALLDAKALAFRRFPEQIPEHLTQFDWHEYKGRSIPPSPQSLDDQQRNGFALPTSLATRDVNSILLTTIKDIGGDTSWVNSALVVAHALAYYHDTFGALIDNDMALEERLRRLVDTEQIDVDDAALPFGRYSVKLFSAKGGHNSFADV
ncbi:hypothetical protein [Carnimonas bestiolae]|uniref:hypothetical protein n=1 Tax=Carnimonas bestiolae TaxID=3402172 RepID=UPI003EDBBCF8